MVRYEWGVSPSVYNLLSIFMLRFMNNNIRCNINKRITAIETMEEIHINKLPSSKHFAVT